MDNMDKHLEKAMEGIEMKLKSVDQELKEMGEGKKGDKMLFRLLDVNADGVLSVDELQRYLVEKKAEAKVFAHYDANGDGVWNFEEASRYAMESILGSIFRKVDVDQSGSIDFDEHFMALKMNQAMIKAAKDKKPSQQERKENNNQNIELGIDKG